MAEDTVVITDDVVKQYEEAGAPPNILRILYKYKGKTKKEMHKMFLDRSEWRYGMLDARLEGRTKSQDDYFNALKEGKKVNAFNPYAEALSILKGR